MSEIFPAQIRGARGILDWSMMDLAKTARVSVLTVKRVEDGASPDAPTKVRLIREALELAGVEFLADEGIGPGVRLRPAGRRPSLSRRDRAP